MPVAALELEHFRNLRHVTLTCAPTLNLFIGANASGKTSLLEALYFLGRARSFRSGQVRELIQHGAEAFRLTATVLDGEGRHVVGLRRTAQTSTLRLDGVPLLTLAELARRWPVLLLNPDSHRLLEDGPQQRRRFMDWGLFHSEPTFWTAWKRYAAALRHRNAALRSGAADRLVDAWNAELAATAALLDPLRNTFCKALESALAPFLEQTLGVIAPQISYRPGWPQNGVYDLAVYLRQGREADRRYGYTRLGPHRADFQVRLPGMDGPLSRGQQKLLVSALLLAQAHLYRQWRNQPCILLIDDLPAELDHAHRERLMRCLAGIEAQLFVTAIERDRLDTSAWPAARLFQIEDGDICEVV